MEPPEPVRILIVEDSVTVAGMLEDLLVTDFDVEVELARDCESTRKLLSVETFDIIMLDYRLPDGHGHQLLEETRELDRPPLAIMVTGHGDENIAALSLRLGASGYVVKDNSLPSTLPDVIGKALDEIALRRAEDKLVESEERYRLLADSSLSGIVLHDGFNILYTNESVSVICGYPQEHFKTIKDLLNLLVPGERDRVVQYMKSRLSGEDVPRVYDTRLIRKDESIAEIQLMNTLTRLKGKLVILVTINDITERVNAQNALREEKAFIESALNTLPDIFCVFDLEGNVIRWNRTLCEVTGYSDDAIASMKTPEFFGENLQYGKETLSKMIKGERVTFETEIRTRDGNLIAYEISGSLLRDDQGNLVAVCTIGRDVSEHNQ